MQQEMQEINNVNFHDHNQNNYIQINLIEIINNLKIIYKSVT